MKRSEWFLSSKEIHAQPPLSKFLYASGKTNKWKKKNQNDMGDHGQMWCNIQIEALGLIALSDAKASTLTQK